MLMLIVWLVIIAPAVIFSVGIILFVAYMTWEVLKYCLGGLVKLIFSTLILEGAYLVGFITSVMYHLTGKQEKLYRKYPIV